jgi:cell division protease FtsH
MARRILIEKSDDFERLAKGLLEYETLTGDEIRKVIAGEPLGGGDDADKPASSGGGGASLAAIPKTRGRAAKPGHDPEPAPL